MIVSIPPHQPQTESAVSYYGEKMKALLVQLPHADRSAFMFPLGISCIASSLETTGCEVEVLDIFALGYTQDDVVNHLRSGLWDVIGISAFSTQYPWAKWITAEIKRLHPQTLVVMGGPLPTFNAKLVLEKTHTDVCVISEGEKTIRDLMRNLGNFNNVPGISFKTTNGDIINTIPRPYISDLDSLPFPKYDIFPMETYFNNLGLFGVPHVKTINMVTSRGCPYGCKFCSRTFKGARYRSVDNIVEEITILKDTYGIKGVSFGDELVLSSKKRSYELCEKIKPLKIYWDCQGRANTVDLDLLKAMKSAGCTSVGYGVESGSQKILDNMNKKVTVKQNEFAVENTLKAGMVPVVQMIYGYPGENRDTVRETIEFFKRIHFYPPVARGEIHINLLTPLPGSPLYAEILASGRIKDEEEYLMQLERGYCAGGSLQINLSEFGDDEIFAQKASMSTQIMTNYEAYIRKHAMHVFNNYYQILKTIWYVEGYKVLGAIGEALLRKIKKLTRKIFISSHV